MNELEKIWARAIVSPTIMSAAAELEFLRELKSLPPSDIQENVDYFCQILDLLYDSHTGGGLFEVNSNNLGEFEAFADWLEGLSNLFGSKSVEYLQSIADVLRINPQIAFEKCRPPQ